MKIKSNVAYQLCRVDNVDAAVNELKSLGWRYTGFGYGRWYFDRLTSDGGSQLLHVVREGDYE